MHGHDLVGHKDIRRHSSKKEPHGETERNCAYLRSHSRGTYSFDTPCPDQVSGIVLMPPFAVGGVSDDSKSVVSSRKAASPRLLRPIEPDVPATLHGRPVDMLRPISAPESTSTQIILVSSAASLTVSNSSQLFRYGPRPVQNTMSSGRSGKG